MTDWAAFTGFTGLVLVVLLSFAYFSRGVPHGDGVSPLASDDADSRVASESGTAGLDDGEDSTALDSDDESAVLDSDNTALDIDHTAFDTDRTSPDSDDENPVAVPASNESEADRLTPTPVLPTSETNSSATDLPTHLLIANVAVSQALLGGFLATGAWYAGIPLSALGISSGGVPTKLGVGIALGVALYGVNRLGSSLSRQLGFAPDEALRESLTPESPAGWVLLLLVALPLIAGFEELLFRGALVGALSVGFEVSPWFLAAVSSVAFGAGHTAQGRLGIFVTGLLGFVLAATFVLTQSLLVVVVAHYLVNALEFVGNELFGW